jgi:hypothetical protein
LTTLGKVISGLAKNQNHIPYRDSALTRFLQDSIAGATTTYLIATIAPLRSYYEESLSTLKFADRAREVMVCAKINKIDAKD